MKSEDIIAKIVNNPEVPLSVLADSFTSRELKGILRNVLEHIDVHIDQGNSRSAQRLFQAASRIVEVIGDARLTIDLTKKKARVLAREGNLQGSLVLLNGLLQRAAESTVRADIHVEMGILCDERGEKAKALEHFKKAASLFRKEGNRYNEAVALFNMSSVLFDLSRLDESLEACESAIALGGADEDSGSLRSHLYHQRANIFDTMANRDDATADYRKALLEYQVQGDRLKSSDIVYKLGSYLGEEGKSRESLRVFHRALALKTDLDTREALAKYYLGRGLVLKSLGNQHAALESLRRGTLWALSGGGEKTARLCRFAVFDLHEKDEPAQSLADFMKDRPKGAPDSSLAVLKSYLSRGSDGGKLERYCETGPSESYLVDRKFLFYLLRRMARMYRILQDQENFLSYYTQTWGVEKKLKGKSLSKEDSP